LAADRVLKRCKGVTVAVNTPRDPEQTRALEEVDGLIQAIVDRINDDLPKAKDVYKFIICYIFN
jgi:hypothetical protein